MRRTPADLALVLAALVAACNDTGDLAPIEPEPGELDGVVVCDGMTFGQLKVLDELTDDCRQRIESIESEAPSNFENRLFLLGSSRAEHGTPTFYVNGADERGRALTAEALAEARVEVTAADGRVVELAPEALVIAPISAEDGPLVAVAIANDYSQTMRDEDLEAVETLEAALLAALPPESEGSVTLFSTDVRVAAEPTSDRTTLDAAIAPEATMPREWTALYDGMSTALEALLERDRPIRLLVVASDGPDNAPSDARRTDVARAISANGIAGFVASALFADAAEFRSLFGARGVVLRAPSMPALPALASEYVASLGQIVKITIPSEHAGASRYRIVLGDSGLVVR